MAGLFAVNFMQHHLALCNFIVFLYKVTFKTTKRFVEFKYSVILILLRYYIVIVFPVF